MDELAGEIYQGFLNYVGYLAITNLHIADDFDGLAREEEELAK